MRDPQPCKSVEDISQVSRKFFCRHYNLCLDYAIQEDWENFSCVECPGYESQQWDQEEWCQDSLRCLKLVWAVAYSKLKQEKADSVAPWRKIKIHRPEKLTATETYLQ